MAIKHERFNIKVGVGIIGAFERIDIENYRIFSEFIDNSLQSFLDHKATMVNVLRVRKCIVSITWTNDEIIVVDNAFGMDKEAFGRALRLDAKAENYSKGSLSKYGIGLKYAAANLGETYTIDSSAYGSKERFIGTVDLEDWKLNNPETMDVDVEDDFGQDRHYTKITIGKLKQKFSNAEMKSVIKNLGIIYSHFLDESKELEIIINNQKVAYVEPEIFVDQNGSEVMRTFNKSFVFDGKKYDFYGWIGILNKGSTQDAGLNLSQNNRVIELRYRPKQIFGNGNDYKYQRLVGNVSFSGDSWEVRVNKDGIAWNGNGLQERFLEELGKLPEVKEIQKAATERRTRESPVRKVKVEAKNAKCDGFKAEYQIGEKVCFTVSPIEGYQLKSVKVNSKEITPDKEDGKSFSFIVDSEMPATTSIRISCNEQKATLSNVVSLKNDGSVIVAMQSPIAAQKTMTEKEKLTETFKVLENTKIPGEAIKPNPNLYEGGVIIKYLNTAFSFEIEKIFDSAVNEWVTLKEIEYPYENSYKLTINYNAGFFGEINFTEETKIAITKLCLCLVLARITSVPYGLSLEKSKIMMNKLNDIIFKSGK